jgi:hypothetical protein
VDSKEDSSLKHKKGRNLSALERKLNSFFSEVDKNGN